MASDVQGVGRPGGGVPPLSGTALVGVLCLVRVGAGIAGKGATLAVSGFLGALTVLSWSCRHLSGETTTRKGGAGTRKVLRGLVPNAIVAVLLALVGLVFAVTRWRSVLAVTPAGYTVVVAWVVAIVAVGVGLRRGDWRTGGGGSGRFEVYQSLAAAAVTLVAWSGGPSWSIVDGGGALFWSMGCLVLAGHAVARFTVAAAGYVSGGADAVQVRRVAATVEGVGKVTKARVRRTGDEIHVYVAVETTAEGDAEAVSHHVRAEICRQLENVRQVIAYSRSPGDGTDGGSAEETFDAVSEGDEVQPGTVWLQTSPWVVFLAGLALVVVVDLAGHALVLPQGRGLGLSWCLSLAVVSLLRHGATATPLRSSLCLGLATSVPVLWMAGHGALGYGTLLAALCFGALMCLLLPGGPLFSPRPRRLWLRGVTVALALCLLLALSADQGAFASRLRLLACGLATTAPAEVVRLLLRLLLLGAVLVLCGRAGRGNGVVRWLGYSLVLGAAVLVTGLFVPLVVLWVPRSAPGPGGKRVERALVTAGACSLVGVVGLVLAHRWLGAPGPLAAALLVVAGSALPADEVHGETST